LADPARLTDERGRACSDSARGAFGPRLESAARLQLLGRARTIAFPDARLVHIDADRVGHEAVLGGNDADLVHGVAELGSRPGQTAVDGLEPVGHRADPAAVLVDEGDPEGPHGVVGDERHLPPGLAAIRGLQHEPRVLRRVGVVRLQRAVARLRGRERELPGDLERPLRAVDLAPGRAAVVGREDQSVRLRHIRVGRRRDEAALLVEELDIERHRRDLRQLPLPPALAEVVRPDVGGGPAHAADMERCDRTTFVFCQKIK